VLQTVATTTIPAIKRISARPGRGRATTAIGGKTDRDCTSTDAAMVAGDKKTLDGKVSAIQLGRFDGHT
jgi:hypothetical protein